MYKISNYKETIDFHVDVEFCAYASKPIFYTINSKTKLGLLTRLGKDTFEFYKMCFYDFWFIMNQYHKIWIAEHRTQTMIRFWQVNELKEKLRDKTVTQTVELINQNMELFQYFCDMLTDSQFSFTSIKTDLVKLSKILIELDKRQNDEYMKTLQTVIDLSA